MSPTQTPTITTEKKIKKIVRLHKIKYFRNPNDWSVL